MFFSYSKNLHFLALSCTWLHSHCCGNFTALDKQYYELWLCNRSSDDWLHESSITHLPTTRIFNISHVLFTNCCFCFNWKLLEALTSFSSLLPAVCLKSVGNDYQWTDGWTHSTTIWALPSEVRKKQTCSDYSSAYSGISKTQLNQ